MAIVDGNPVNATYTNSRVMSKQDDNSILGYISTSQYYAAQKTDVATSATINALSTASGFIKLTGTTATTLNGLASGSNGKEVFLYNGSTALVTIVYQSGSASSSDQITTPNGLNVLMEAGTSAIFKYDSSATKWILINAPGVGNSKPTGPFNIANNQVAPANVTGLTIDGSVYTSAIIDVQLQRTGVMSRQQLTVYYKSSTWVLAQESTGDDCGVIFSITTSLGIGQVQYISDNTTSGTMYWKINSKFEV